MHRGLKKNVEEKSARRVGRSDRKGIVRNKVASRKTDSRQVVNGRGEEEGRTEGQGQRTEDRERERVVEEKGGGGRVLLSKVFGCLPQRSHRAYVG